MAINIFEIDSNRFLKYPNDGYYSIDFYGYRQTGILTFLHRLKNQNGNEAESMLNKCKDEAKDYIVEFLSTILKKDSNDDKIIVCRIPRSKAYFKENKLYFQKAIKEAIEIANRDLNSIDGCVAFCDSAFPKHKNIKDTDKPILLTYKGDLKLLDENLLKIAVIGLLNPCDKIRVLEEQILDSMLKKDAVIISGLANGCDEIAHKYTLKKGGATVAILPSTLKNILPKSNATLAQDIVAQGGLLISEYYADITHYYELTKRYIDRDRLQALFSNAVCLIASYNENDRKNDRNKDAGSRHALQKAKEYGITRLAPRGLERDERFNLNRDVLKNGAKEINKDNINSVLDGLFLDCHKSNHSLHI